MTAFRLLPREGTQTFHKIASGRKWVGRVCQHDDGDWLGVIGATMVKRPTRELAFDDVVATHLGYPNGATLRERNRRVGRAKRDLKRVGDYVMQEVDRGNFKPLDKMLETPQGATVVVAAFTRSLLK